MGTSHSWAELNRKLNALASDAASMPKGQVGRAALATKTSVKTLMPDRLSGVGKRGARLTVRYTESGESDNAAARVFVNGPAHLIENDTRAHRIPKQDGKVIVIPGIGVRAHADHPGTKGKHPWARGVAAALPLIEREFNAAGALLIRRHF